jgi:hypothetical protein
MATVNMSIAIRRDTGRRVKGYQSPPAPFCVAKHNHRLDDCQYGSRPVGGGVRSRPAVFCSPRNNQRGFDGCEVGAVADILCVYSERPLEPFLALESLALAF